MPSDFVKATTPAPETAGADKSVSTRLTYADGTTAAAVSASKKAKATTFDMLQQLFAKQAQSVAATAKSSLSVSI
jgi:hypothetical protein